MKQRGVQGRQLGLDRREEGSEKSYIDEIHHTAKFRAAQVPGTDNVQSVHDGRGGASFGVGADFVYNPPTAAARLGGRRDWLIRGPGRYGDFRRRIGRPGSRSAGNPRKEGTK